MISTEHHAIRSCRQQRPGSRAAGLPAKAVARIGLDRALAAAPPMKTAASTVRPMAPANAHSAVVRKSREESQLFSWQMVAQLSPLFFLQVPESRSSGTSIGSICCLQHRCTRRKLPRASRTRCQMALDICVSSASPYNSIRFVLRLRWFLSLRSRPPRGARDPPARIGSSLCRSFARAKHAVSWRALLAG